MARRHIGSLPCGRAAMTSRRSLALFSVAARCGLLHRRIASGGGVWHGRFRRAWAASAAADDGRARGAMAGPRPGGGGLSAGLPAAGGHRDILRLSAAAVADMSAAAVGGPRWRRQLPAVRNNGGGGGGAPPQGKRSFVPDEIVTGFRRARRRKRSIDRAALELDATRFAKLSADRHQALSLAHWRRPHGG